MSEYNYIDIDLADRLFIARSEILRLTAKIDRLRAAVATVDGLHEPLQDSEWLVTRCTQCDVEWPCDTHLALQWEEARRG